MIKINKIYLTLFCCSLITVLFQFLLQGNKGFSLADEGYLWYGAQRVYDGEVPLRDFMSYDPGRYYWSSAFFAIFSDNGIMTLRIALASFQVIGLFVGIYLLFKDFIKLTFKNYIYIAYVVVILMLWMFPRHKLIDINISIILIGVLTYLVKNNTKKSLFITGVFVGIAATFGRNHGTYGAFASIMVILLSQIDQKNNINIFHSFAYWVAGIFVGFSPIFIMALLIPNFGTAFIDSVLFMLNQSTTNLPLPVPWPWVINSNVNSNYLLIKQIFIGLFFIAILVFSIVSMLWVFYKRYKKHDISPVLVAAAFLSLPYSHYAFSRADAGHLAQGLFPFLIGCLVLIATLKSGYKLIFSLLLLVSTIFSTMTEHPGWNCFQSKNCVEVNISDNTLKVHPAMAAQVSFLKQVSDQYAPNGESFISTPFWPGAYALLERKAPVWEVYALWKRGEDFEKVEINRIKEAKPTFVVIQDYLLDGREDLLFKNTHPLVHQYILDNFEPDINNQNSLVKVYKKRDI